jgi:hypothetical protein
VSDVVIKIEVNDADAQAKLSKLEARLLRLKAAGASTGDAFDGLSGDIDNTTNSSSKLSKSLNDNDNHLRRLAKSTGYTEKELKRIGGPFKIFGRVLGGVGKFAKYAAIEFGVMSIVLGGLKLALIAGELAIKGWNMALRASAAGVGVFIGGVATALAAIRELNNARLTPFARQAGQVAMDGRVDLVGPVGGVMGDRQLGMFDDKSLTGAISAQLRAGQQLDAQFRSTLQVLGNFAVVADDPNKAIAGLSGAFSKARQEGSFTEDIIKSISESSPELAKAITDSGMGVDAFTQALIDGRVDGLEAFTDALDVVNNTLMGKAKGAFRALKEQLTEVGQPLVDGLKPALTATERLLSNFLSSVTPVIQDVLGRLFPQLAGSGDSILGKALDKLAVSINQNLPKLEGLMDRFKGGWKAVEGFFSRLADGMTNASSGFDTLYNNILKPLGSEIWKTITHAVEGFNDVINDTSGVSGNFADRISKIFDGVRSLIDGFNEFRKAIAPLVDALLSLMGVLGKLLELPGIGLLAAMFGTSAIIGGKARKANTRGTTGSANAMNNVAGFLSMGMYNPLGTQRTKNAPQFVQDYRTLRGMGDVSRREAAGVIAGYAADGVKASVGTAVKAAAPTLLALGGSLVGGAILNNAKPSDAGSQVFGQALSMGGLGASVGFMAGGPVGAAIGGGIGLAVGGVTGLFSARAARDKELKEARASGEDMSTAGMNPNRLFGSGGVVAQMNKNRETIAMLNQFDTFMTQRKDLSTSIDSKLDAFYTANKVSVDRAGLMNEELTQAEKDASVVAANRGFITDLKNLDPTARAEAIKRLKDLSTLPTEIKDELERFASVDANVGGIAEKFGNSADEIKKFAEGLEEGNLKLAKGKGVLENNYRTLSNVLNLTQDEAANFADNLGINMLERLITFEDVLTGLGYAFDETGQILDDAANRSVASTRLLSGVMKSINKELDTLQKEEAVVTSRTQFFGTGGTAAQVAQNGADYFQSVLQNATQQYIDSALQAENDPAAVKMTFEQMTQSVLDRLDADFAAAGNVSGAVADRFRANRATVGAELEKAKTQFGPRIQYDSAFAKDAQSILNAQIGGVLTKSGGFQTADELDAAGTSAALAMRDELKKKYPSMQFDEANLNAMKRFVLAGLQDGTPAMTNAMITGADYLVQKLATTPITVITRTSDPFAANRKDPLTGEILSDDEIARRAAAAAGGNVAPKKDTSTPRYGKVGDTASSQFERTLGKHMAFNSGLAGSRTITSGLRNWGLGSPSSDHRFGNAYDLTGDNLGAYAESVNGSGGFAEFHGAAGTRHLHVVPPAGDTATAMAGAMSGMVSGGSNTYNISVVGGPGTDEAELARRVMAEIERRERDRQERR